MPITPKKIFIETIADYHRLANTSKPEHPLVSLVKFEDLSWQPEGEVTSLIRDFYIIALKKNVNTKFKYGQENIKFNEGVLHFMAPKQVLTIEYPDKVITNSGWQLLIHPNLFIGKSLSKTIRQYPYFHYRFDQSLPLKPGEESIILRVFHQIQEEMAVSLNQNTNTVLLAQIELLLAYIDRFYTTRQDFEKDDTNNLLEQVEDLINQYLDSDQSKSKGWISVQFIADQLNLSPNYLSRLLQRITGRSTQQFLQDKLIELAKEKLSITDKTVSEIAFELYFSSSQSFSRLFKVKTGQTPSEFRKAFGIG